MDFSNILNDYIDKINCTSKQLAMESNISPSLISRYRNGQRIPKYNSKQYTNLINGLARLSKDSNITKNSIKESFDKILKKDNIDFDIFINNLNILIKELNINNSELSKYIGFDSSYISKIRTGNRKPHSIEKFTLSICKYLQHKFNTDKDKKLFSKIIECDKDNFSLEDIYTFLVTNKSKKESHSISCFLTKLDDFDLNEYIKKTKFDKLKVPSVPIQLPKTKMYYGLNGFKNSQLDLLKQIILSKSKSDVFFYSNMPMYEASKDLEFTKKFMIGLAFLLKKGLKLNIIHNLNRPINEIIIGLEGWIPLYMTGQINPYYIDDSYKNIYNTLECYSSNNCLTGICLNNINSAKMYLSNKKDDIEISKKNSTELLKIAKPLIKIFTKNNNLDFKKHIQNLIKLKGNRRNIYSKLPIYTISDTLLNDILLSNNLSKKEIEIIKNYVNEYKNYINTILSNNRITDEFQLLTKEEFEKKKNFLSFSFLFLEKEIYYTYEQYLKHVDCIKKFKNKNYSYKINNRVLFQNINIHIIENKQVIISKENIPSIHFIITNNKLVSAIENF